MKYFLLLFVLLFSNSCQNEIENTLKLNTSKEYIIKKGNHHIYHQQIAKHINNTLFFEATFNESAIYKTIDPSNQSDINKLFGFSDCTEPHHENSARFGWCWLDDQLKIFTYCYKDGQPHYQYLTTVNLNQTYKYSIIISSSEYIFECNGIIKRIPRGCNQNYTGRYYLFPYFGGDEKAPHDITIRIKEL